MKLRRMEVVIRRGLDLSPSPRGDVAEWASGSGDALGEIQEHRRETCRSAAQEQRGSLPRIWELGNKATPIVITIIINRQEHTSVTAGIKPLPSYYEKEGLANSRENVNV